MRYEMMSDTPSPPETKELKSTVEMLEPGVSLEHFRFEMAREASERAQEQIPGRTGTAFESGESSQRRTEAAFESVESSQRRMEAAFESGKNSQDGFERESDTVVMPEYLERGVRDWLDTGEGIWEKHTGELLSDLGMETQLGLPYLEKKDGELRISFRPHEEVYTGEGITIYEQRYALECRYPSEKIVRFEVLPQKSPDAVAKIEAATMKSEGKYLLEDLQKAFCRIRDICREDGNAPDVSVKKYQKLYWKTVDALGLSGVYGEQEGLQGGKR